MGDLSKESVRLYRDTKAAINIVHNLAHNNMVKDIKVDQDITKEELNLV